MPSPFAVAGDLVEVAPGVGFLATWANVTALKTDEGLVLIDTGSAQVASHVGTQLRRYSDARVDTVVYTHGHLDHVTGIGALEADAAARGFEAPRVVGHVGIAARFDRYRATAGYNEVINRRQFGLEELRWPRHYRYPDLTYTATLELDLAGRRLELHHALGETDDATWVYDPAQRVLCTGDLFIWVAPNAGNPQKVQRYPAEWAAALREMARLDAKVLLPGHGLPILGRDRVRLALSETAELLESLVEQTMALLNAGARLDEAIHTVAIPPHLAERPYLQCLYDEPEFIVHNLWRRYGGWWDGNPATLKPAPEQALGAELAELAGGTAALCERARTLLASGDEVEGRAAADFYASLDRRHRQFL